jgi:hypothetical protein
VSGKKQETMTVGTFRLEFLQILYQLEPPLPFEQHHDNQTVETLAVATHICGKPQYCFYRYQLRVLRPSVVESDEDSNSASGKDQQDKHFLTECRSGVVKRWRRQAKEFPDFEEGFYYF